ncbi:hypothetical protein C8F01DRAFT_1186226 [Mycena amicta]|nr:hypothetical protein C8F01DRAFT_1186226 [Mycena amicta]
MTFCRPLPFHSLPLSLSLLLAALFTTAAGSDPSTDPTNQAIFRAASNWSPFPPANATHQASALQACEQITTSLGPDIVQSSGSEYDFTTQNAWNVQNALFTPTCIVFPRNTGDVQTAMRAIYDAGSHYAVQAGSHSAMKGWNTVQEGVLIVFSRMQNVSYDATKNSVTIEPGIHWGDATAQLSSHGVAVVGGRVAGVGTGLLLGGGISFLSPSQGFAADNFLALDVVLVDGTLVTATATNEYSDLFRALKGGANRFGIVTRYEVRAVHVGTPEEKPFYGGFNIYPPSSAEAVMKAVAKYVREVNDPNASLMTVLTTTLVKGTPQQSCIVFMFYTGDSLPTSIYADFLAITPLMSSMGPQAWTDILPTVDPPMFDSSPRGFVQHFGSLALNGQESGFLNALTEFRNFSSTFVNASAGSGLKSTSLWLTPITAYQLALGRAKGGNVFNSPDRTKPYTLIQHSQKFDAGLLDIPPAVQKGIDLVFERVPPSEGVPLYVNECDVSQNVFETYGEYEFLKETYKKYDPERFNVQHQQGPIGL